MVVEAEITILFQIVLYLNLIYLIQQQIKWFHGFLLVDKQWGLSVWDNSINTGSKEITFPISFLSNGYELLAIHHYERANDSFLCIKFRNMTKTSAILDFKDISGTNNLYGRAYYFSLGK